MAKKPLPEKLRPNKLSGFVGQKQLVGKSGLVRKLIINGKKNGFFPSVIFWGPPGSGKTTLARIIANEMKRKFFEFSAVNTSVKDIEKVTNSNLSASESRQQTINLAKDQQLSFSRSKKIHPPSATHHPPIIFIDEIHRFNKAQQDRLLPHVERGNIIFIGATTENPSFEVIGPLLSRSRVLVLNQLGEKELRQIIKKGETELKVRLKVKAKKFLIEASNGDARAALNVLEIADSLSTNHLLDISDIEAALQQRYLTFDKKGEEYYNLISAFIKSMRGSDADAALYYLARMVQAGQDPLYIARRMVVFASEDIGMAQPTALVVANEIFKACETIGYPECAINLAHGTVYLAKAKKDRSAYEAYFKAVADVKKHGNLPVPMNIRNAPTKLMKDLGYGKNYQKYTKKSLLPTKIKEKKYYNT